MGSTVESAGAVTVRVVDGEASIDDSADTRLQDESLIGRHVGRYVVLEEVGRGAMGQVLRAYDPQLQREVALKELRLPLRGDTEVAAQLVAEARAMAKLSHPNVVGVFDVQDVEGDGQRLLIVMEFVAGTTLRQWLDASVRSWDEILDVFVRAGRGLAAAHANGLLHRDFKPANVMVGPDVVKVADFGLAKPDPTQDSLGSSLDDPTAIRGNISGTAASMVVGTPRYMAPEQHLGRELGPQADQFAYCVALREALVGEAPFSRRGVVEGKLKGPPPWPRSDVPTHIANAIDRGLAPKAQDRWPTMDALLDALTPAPAKGHGGWMIALGGLAAMGLLLASEDAAGNSPCQGAQQKLLDAWGDSQRDAVQAAFESVDAPYAASSGRRAQAALDEYANAWASQYTDSCRATAIRKEQSEAVMDLRMACLHRARLSLAAASDVFSRADAKVARRADKLVSNLVDLKRCEDVSALMDSAPAPSAREADAVAEIQAHLAQSRAERTAGRFEPAAASVEQAVAAVETIEYGPIHTRVEFERGQVHNARGDYDAAAHHLKQALRLASQHRQLEIMESAGQDLMVVVGFDLRRPDEAMAYRELVEGLSQGRPTREADLHSAVASILYRKGEFAEAENEHRKALELERSVRGDKHPRVADFHNNLALSLSGQGKFEDAERHFLTTLQVHRELLGEDHPDVATAQSNLATARLQLGRYEDAERGFRAALQHRVRLLGQEHRLVAQSKGNLAATLRSLKRYDEAERLQRESIETLESLFGPDDPDLETGLSNLAITLSERGEHAAAIETLRTLLSQQAGARGPAHPVTTSTRTNLGVVLHQQGDLNAAEKELRVAKKAFRESLGADHPLLGSAQHALGEVLADAGRPDEARTELEAALALRRRVLGEEHPDTESTKNVLAGLTP